MKLAVILVILIEVFNIYTFGDSRGSHEYDTLRQVPRNVRTAESPTDNPCNYTPLRRPDFSAPERRISEVKCYEYIWEIKKREDDIQKATQCFLWTISQPGYPNIHPPIVGGRITKPGEFPHMGALGWRAAIGTWIFKCGSTLISSKFLLTAAHCSQVPSYDTSVANTRPEIVRLGDKNIADVYSNGRFPEDAKIKRIINHPNYNPPKKYFDIAIIEVTEDVQFTKYVQPACLWGHFDTRPLGNKATPTGWGVVETACRKSSPELQAAVVDILDSNQCDHLLQPYCNRLWCGLESHQLCAGKLNGGVDDCQGDSGGPLQVKIPLPVTSQGSMHYVIGITSFGTGCALPNLPGIYTRVSSFIDWIEDVVWRGS